MRPGWTVSAASYICIFMGGIGLSGMMSDTERTLALLVLIGFLFILAVINQGKQDHG